MALLFAASFGGYFHYLVNIKKVSLFAAPAVIVTSISAVMCLAGLVNTMLLCLYLIIAAGIMLLWKYRKELSFRGLSGNIFPLALCGILLIYLVYYTKGGVYADGDTMTHWGIIVKSIYEDGRLPNFSNIEIEYQSYPPATACWIFFVLKILGYSEARALLAQGLWMYACVISMFAVNKTRSKPGDVLIFLLALYLLRGLDDLRVDVILALVTIAAFVVAEEERADSKRLVWILLPFLFVLPLVKSSGLLFAIFVVCLAVCIVAKDGGWKQTVKMTGKCALIPVAAWYLWKSHTKMVYAGANYSMHSFSSEYMQSVFESKTSEDIHTIFEAYLAKWFSFNSSCEWQALLLFAVMAVAAVWLCKQKREVLTLSALMVGFYFVYKIGLFLMYLLSMYGAEALYVASYERYQQTFTMLMLFVALWIYLGYVQTAQEIRSAAVGKVACMGIAAVICFGLCVVDYESMLRPDYAYGGIHRRMVTMINDNDELDVGDKVLTYHSYQFTYYLVRHTFENWDSTSTHDLTRIEEALTSNHERYEWLILLEKDEQIQELLRQYGYSEDVDSIPLIDWSEG